MEQSHYEINVTHTYESYNGNKRTQHLFATAPRSCVTRHQMQIVLREFRKRFKAKDGFGITVTSVDCHGIDVTDEAMSDSSEYKKA